MTEAIDRQALAESERSIGAVRCILALLGAALALGSRMGDGGGVVSIPSIGIAMSIVATAVLLWHLPRALWWLGLSPKSSAIVLQLIDIVAALGLIYVVSAVLPDAGWALLTIPIVIASLRLSAIGVLWVWLTTSLGYTGLLWSELVEPGREAIGTSLVLERPGALLALAAGVALLTRWLQAGWVEQAQLAGEAQLRFQHVQAIERAGREMRGRTPAEVVTTCLHHVVELGFDAATITGADRSLVAVGDGSIVPADEVIDRPAPDLVELTEWHGPSGTVYSAAMIEPRSDVVISGWSLNPPGTLQADALSELVAHTTSGVELAELLGQARFEADHDALTGLANRARFERRLGALAQEARTIAMLFMDLDHFKGINDLHGHETGDWALRQVGDVLRRHFDGDGLAARYGGDEFVAILSGRSATEVQGLAEQLLASVAGIAERPPPEGQRVEVGISIGIALAAGPIDPDELRRAADRAVFDAKHTGRGRIATTWVSPSAAPVDGVEPPLDHVAPEWLLGSPSPLPPPVPLSALPVPLRATDREPAAEPSAAPLVGTSR